MAWWNGEDDRDEQRETGGGGFLSGLWSAVKWTAGILLGALAVVLGISYLTKNSDTVKNALNGTGITKNEQGQGDLGDRTAGLLDTAKEKGGKLLDNAKEKGGKAVDKTLEFFGLKTPPVVPVPEIAIKSEQVKAESMENLAGLGATAAVTLVAPYKAYQGLKQTGTVTREQVFVPHTKEDKLAIKALEKSEKELKALQQSEEALQKKLGKLAESTEKLSGSKIKLWNPTTWFPETRASYNSSIQATVAEELTKLKDKISLAKESVSSAMNVVSSSPTMTRAGNMVASLKSILDPAAEISLPSMQTVTEVGKKLSGAVSTTGSAVSSVAQPVLKVVGPVAAVTTAYTDLSHANELWEHKNEKGEYDARGTAIVQILGTVPEALGLAVAPVPVVGTTGLLVGSAIKDGLFALNTAVTGEQRMTPSNTSAIIKQHADPLIDKHIIAPLTDSVPLLSKEELKELNGLVEKVKGENPVKLNRDEQKRLVMLTQKVNPSAKVDDFTADQLQASQTPLQPATPSSQVAK